MRIAERIEVEDDGYATVYWSEKHTLAMKLRQWVVCAELYPDDYNDVVDEILTIYHGIRCQNRHEKNGEVYYG